MYKVDSPSKALMYDMICIQKAKSISSVFRASKHSNTHINAGYGWSLTVEHCSALKHIMFAKDKNVHADVHKSELVLREVEANRIQQDNSQTTRPRNVQKQTVNSAVAQMKACCKIQRFTLL